MADPMTPDRLAELERECGTLRAEIIRLTKITKLQAAALEVWKAGKATKPA